MTNLSKNFIEECSSHQLLGLHKNEFSYYATAGRSIVFIFHFVQPVINKHGGGHAIL